MLSHGANSRRPAALRRHAPAPTAAAVANLAPVSERQNIISLHMLLTNKKNPETRAVARLGDVLLPWFEKTVARPAARMQGMAELWQEHVPAKILPHCRLVGFHRGTMTVALDSTTVRAELDARLRSGLLRILQTSSRGALFRVKTCVESHLSGK
jgi:hypothetical protein